MMRDESLEEDPKVNIMLRSETTTREDKGKQPTEGEWVRKAPEKETGFDLERTKQTFMETKKSFTKASTSRSLNKLPDTSIPTEVDPSVLTTFLETCMKLPA